MAALFPFRALRPAPAAAPKVASVPYDVVTTDEAKALEAKKVAEKAMQNRTSKLEIAQAQAELATAMVQLAAIQKLRRRR